MTLFDRFCHWCIKPKGKGEGSFCSAACASLWQQAFPLDDPEWRAGDWNVPGAGAGKEQA